MHHAVFENTLDLSVESVQDVIHVLIGQIKHACHLLILFATFSQEIRYTKPRPGVAYNKEVLIFRFSFCFISHSTASVIL